MVRIWMVRLFALVVLFTGALVSVQDVELLRRAWRSAEVATPLFLPVRHALSWMIGRVALWLRSPLEALLLPLAAGFAVRTSELASLAAIGAK